MTEKAMNLSYLPVDEWPPLAWLAVCDGSGSVSVAHGNRVETHPHWFAEAVWAGAYEQADFDDTDLVFGTGGRLRGEGLVFVSSATVVDRLHALEAHGRTWVSNSLACLLAAVGATVDPHYHRYFHDFESIIGGLTKYRRTLASSAGPVRLTYYDNLAWQAGRLVEVHKPYPKRDFSTFARYRDFLEDTLCRLAENSKAPQRTHPYDLLATISSGYDSPTVAAVARRAGLRQTLSFAQARDGRPDSGAEVARRLGLEPLLIDSRAWQKGTLPEVPFIAADAKGEDVYYGGAAEVLRGRLLLTGYGGSRVWDKGIAPPEHLERSDQSGLSLCEYRLWAGFLHCPVTLLAARQTQDLRNISNSPEMAAWDVPGGYSRPICRRLLEEAGVPRQLFGQEKKAASILFFDRHSFLSPGSLADYQAWRHAHALAGRTPLRLVREGLAAGARTAVRGVQALAGALHRAVPVKLLARLSKSGKLTAFARYERLFAHVFPWALERATERYRCSLPLSRRLEGPLSRRQTAEVVAP
jgi:hypothetical protein